MYRKIRESTFFSQTKGSRFAKIWRITGACFFMTKDIECYVNLIFWWEETMISLSRILKLRDLEIFHVLNNGYILAYVIIEDTKNPFTEEDKKMEPLCYMDEKDINEILNVIRISLINDEAFTKEDSITLRTYFADFVNNTNLTNFIIKEYIQEDLYDNDDNIESFNKILQNIGSSYFIEEFDEINWIYLSQD